jgi:hypothetical protein
MTARNLLAADIARRYRRRLLLFYVPVAIVMLWANVQLGEAPRVFAVSIGFALALGPLLVLRWVPRTVWYLPVSRRDIWRAGWLFATVGTTLALLGLKIVTMLLLLVPPSLDFAGVSPVLSFSTVLLSTVFDFAATGIGCLLVIVATLPPKRSRAGHRLLAIARDAADMILQLAFFAIWFSAARLSGWLPLRWSDFTPATALALAAALGVTIATWFHTPNPPALARQAPVPRAQREPAASHPRCIAGLSGLPRLLAHEYWVALAIGAALSAGSFLVVIVMANMVQSPQAVVDLLRDELQFMDQGVLHRRDRRWARMPCSR